MPSAGTGTRLRTRVFGAKVLRSGKRLWTPIEKKNLKAANEDKLIRTLDDGEVGGGGDASLCKENGWHESDAFQKKQEATKMDVDLNSDCKTVEPKLERHTVEFVNENSNVCRRWGVVYRRKRSRARAKNPFEAYDDSSQALEEGRRFGKYFVRQRWKKKARKSPEASSALPGSISHSIVINSAHSSGRWMHCLLNSLLGSLRSSSVNLAQVFAFISSKPICDVFSLHGIRFLKEYSPEMKAGVCIISAVRCSVPLFTVNFSAIPCCFMYLHTRLSLKSGLPSNAPSVNSMAKDEDYESENLENPVVASDKDDSRKWIFSQPTVRLPKLSTRNSQLRNGRTIQKRRRAMRSRRSKLSSIIGLNKANGALVSEGFRFRHNGMHSGLRILGNKTSPQNIKEIKSAMVESRKDLDATSCSANLLVIEPDKCYREEGVVIALELSLSKQWTLAVKSRGMMRYTLTAEKVMRPCSSNRVTHDIIWTVNNSWKLEFPNRRDWSIFKELYKECSDRNVQPSIVSTIPVPRICELSGYTEGGTIQFSRPDSYITVKSDELTRALDRRTANYDLDTDDEEWLNEFNNSHHQCISIEKFELMIDSLEKWGFCNPDDYTDENAALSNCLDSERKEIAQAVHSYWRKKRKQKRFPLIKIFRLYQPRKTLMITRSVLRKKRSFKRQAGRGKQRSFLQALAAQQDAQQQERVKEAKAAANRHEGLAVVMRQKAQQLMENADLATYKAMMALRIAEAARIAAVSIDNGAASLFPS